MARLLAAVSAVLAAGCVLAARSGGRAASGCGSRRVNGTSVTRRIHLPGNHGAWRPVATTESWSGDAGACNSYSFRFSNVAVAGRPGGKWSPMRPQVIAEPGFRVVRLAHAGFVASGT